MAFRESPTDQRGDDEPVDLSGVEASRRRFLRRAATGVVAVGAGSAVLGGLASAAGAQTGTTPGSAGADNTTGSAPPGSTPGSMPDATPTTTAGKPPTIEGTDLAIGIFVSSLEIAVISLYDAMLTNGQLAPAATQQARTFKTHHQDQLKKLETFTLGQAPTVGNPRATAEYLPRVQSAKDEVELATIGQKIEDRLAATYQWAMTEITEWQLAAVIATIGPVDAQQAVAWSQVLVPDFDTWVTQDLSTIVPDEQTTDGRFDEAGYPPAEG